MQEYIWIQPDLPVDIVIIMIVLVSAIGMTTRKSFMTQQPAWHMTDRQLGK